MVMATKYSMIMATNLESYYHMCQLTHPFLKASGAGNIVLISSVAGLVHVSVGFVYSVTKGMVCLAPYFISDFIWKQLAIVSIQTRLRAMVARDEFRRRRNTVATIVQVLWMNYVCKVFKKMIRNKGEFVQIS
ncbi:unnamed protein product [Lactuca saligna]|uniref:Uncharacterized protein n=1 Tax=Lactuca saligna TaxID=75948 RepID=A0AA35YTZ8_LACSI|nr:unnamed protein product [Lactuca saligna]